MGAGVSFIEDMGQCRKFGLCRVHRHIHSEGTSRNAFTILRTPTGVRRKCSFPCVSAGYRDSLTLYMLMFSISQELAQWTGIAARCNKSLSVLQTSRTCSAWIIRARHVSILTTYLHFKSYILYLFFWSRTCTTYLHRTNFSCNVLIEQRLY